MNIFDIVIILLILLAGVTGMKRGAIKELVMLVGTVIIYFLAFKLKDPLASISMLLFPFFDFIGNIKGLIMLNVLLYQALAFAVLALIFFFIFDIILKVTGIFQKLVDWTIILTLPSKIIGFILGLVSGYVFMFILLIIFSVPLGGVSMFSSSNLVNKILYESPVLSNYLGGFKDVVKDVYDVSKKTVEGEENINNLNLDIADKLLKYKVVNSKDLEKVVEDTDKLNSVKGIEEVIYKYK